VKRILTLALLAIPPVLAAAGAAAPAVIGEWNCVGKDANGMETSWILSVRQSGKQLEGTLRSATTGDAIDILNAAQDGEKFHFQVRINATEVVDLDLTMAGDRFTGRFHGKDSGSGTFAGTRAAANVSGKWSGDWEIGPDDAPGPHYMILQQDGGKVTGTAGPRPDYQMAIQKGNIAGGKLTFEVAVAETLALRFSLMVAGDEMHGDAVLVMNGTEKTLKLAAKRVGK
jgi:hypothetical protein